MEVHQNMMSAVTQEFMPGWELDVPEYLYDEDEDDSEDTEK
jgi:hypothetical protein